LKRLLIIFSLVISTILVAQNAVWDNPKPFVLGNNFELQSPSIKTSDGNTIFFWSKTELDGRIIYATKLNEQGEYQWEESNKIVLEKEPYVILSDILELENNNYVLKFRHQDYKDAPIDYIYTIMDANGNTLWNSSFSSLAYNDDMYPDVQVNDIISGFNILCHNTSTAQTIILHFDLDGNITEYDVSNYSYANHQISQMINYNGHYYILYEENNELFFSKLNNNFEPINTTIISLNIDNYSVSIYPFNNEFYLVEQYNEIVCKISESGELIWTTFLNNSYYKTIAGITTNGNLFILGNYSNETIDYYLIDNDGNIEVELSVLQDLDMSGVNFYYSYNNEDKINVIVASTEDDIYCYLAQTLDIEGTLTYPTDGLQLGIDAELRSLVLNSYPDIFSFLFLERTDNRTINLAINSFNENGMQIIPAANTVLKASFISCSMMACSQYLENENKILLAFVSNREYDYSGEIYLQKIDQSGNLMYEEESLFLNTYVDIRDVFINETGFVFVVYKLPDTNETLNCDVFSDIGEFVRSYNLDDNINNYCKVTHNVTDNGVIVSWFNRNTTTLKINKFDENDFIWNNPISITLVSSVLSSFNLSDNYILFSYSNVPGYVQKLYRFEDDGSLSTGWQYGYNINNIDNLNRIVKISQTIDNLYFMGMVSSGGYQLFGINSNQEVLFEDLGITIDYGMSPPDLLTDENIYLAYRDTTLQCAVLEKYDMSGQNLWSNNAVMWDFSKGYTLELFRSGDNGVSILVPPLTFASMDLDGNNFTPFEGEVITDSRGGKTFVSAHEMECGQIMFTWLDYCVSNLIYDPDYSAIAGRLYDFSNLSNNDNTIPFYNTYHLSNYPNPFNPNTTISFSIPNKSEIELSVYNIKGQKVKALLKDNLEKGNYSIDWNGYDDSDKPVSSGIYLYNIIVNSKIEVVKKCLLLK